MTSAHWSDALAKAGATREVVAYARSHSTLESAWEECEAPRIMFDFAAAVGVDLRPIVLAACDIARTALHLVPAGEDRPRLAIEAAEAWCRGLVSVGVVRSAARAAYAAGAEQASIIRARIPAAMIAERVAALASAREDGGR